MTGQVQAFFQMLPDIPMAIILGNINYIDKTIQQALIPRSILFVFIPLLCVIATASTYIFPLPSSIIYLPSSFFHLKWWGLLIIICLALLAATPKSLRHLFISKKLQTLPLLAWKMLQNFISIDHKNRDFIHTTHNK